MKATLIEKALNAHDWTARYEQLKWQGEADKDEVVIEKTIMIPLLDYEKLTSELLTDSRLITENLNTMYQDKDGIWHCLKITARGSKTSLLVESEGYSYPRISAIINKK